MNNLSVLVSTHLAGGLISLIARTSALPSSFSPTHPFNKRMGFSWMFSDECLGSQPRGSATSHSGTLLAASYHRRIRLLQAQCRLHR